MTNIKRHFSAIVHSIIVIIIFLMTNATNAYAQGAWDLRYIPFDSLSHAFIGKEIRIDFKATDTDTLLGDVNVLDIRKLLSKEDTISLVIAGKSIKFKESWNLYVDNGVLVEQTLKSNETNENEVIYIKEMNLQTINKTALTIEVAVYSPAGISKELIIINKSLIKGILIRIEGSVPF